MAKILIVEDDLELLSGLKDAMASQGYTVEVSTDGDDALDKLKAYKFDLVVLDWQLPGTSGVDVCTRYRGTGGLTPVIMLTGKSLIENKEEGLYAGADDYLTKPFEMRELLARVRACLRRPYTFTGDTLTVEDIVIEFDTRKVLKNGSVVDLLPMEYKLLEFLMRHRGQTFSASALLDRVWKSTSDVSEDAVRTCVKTLRRKIANSDGSSVLETVYGVGYKVS